MKEPFTQRLRHAWDAFRNEERQWKQRPYPDIGVGSGRASGKSFRQVSNSKNTISAIFSRIAIDVAEVRLRHARVDENDIFIEEIRSDLNDCLRVEANIDQSAKDFVRDIVITMFDEGHAAIVPVDTTLDPLRSGSYGIKSMRVGKVTEWYPRHVKILVYNDRKGEREEITLPKNIVAIVENPLHLVVNEPNGTLRRLLRKINLLDAHDEQVGSNKLDLIVQLPYVIKNETRRKEAEARRTDIEVQLASSKFGVAYIDGTEKVTQLNRPVENNLTEQVENLTRKLYGQLGITESILDGSATEEERTNYYNNTVKPIISAIADNMNRKFLTKTARTQGQVIHYHQDMFKLIPVSNLADIADKFLRNEILSPNEFRAIVGYKPSDDPSADELRNRNVSEAKEDSDQDEGDTIEEEETNEEKV